MNVISYVTCPRDMITWRTWIFIYKSGDTVYPKHATCRLSPVWTKLALHVTRSLQGWDRQTDRQTHLQHGFLDEYFIRSQLMMYSWSVGRIFWIFVEPQVVHQHLQLVSKNIQKYRTAKRSWPASCSSLASSKQQTMIVNNKFWRSLFTTDVLGWQQQLWSDAKLHRRLY